MAGQAHHFLKYAPGMEPPNDLPYAKARYQNEVCRLYSVLNRRLADHEYVAGDYSIADMAIWPWASRWENQAQDITRFPHMKGWLDRVCERQAVQQGRWIGKDHRTDLATDREAQKVLFGQTGT
jgi:GST-like protein